MSKLSDFFRVGTETPAAANDNDAVEHAITQDDHKEQLEHDMSILTDGAGVREKRVHREAEKEVVSAAEDSLKKLHVIQMGRCPQCGEHLRRHLFATICESCGWHQFDTPRHGPVRVHLRDSDSTIDGDRCYMVKTGAALVMKQDVVVAKVPRDAVLWVEYLWSDEEVASRHKQIAQMVDVSCGWCGSKADPGEDGFHLVHVAFGTSQERYCFCSDDCYEAFRKMYPARVHRNCYERNCADCDQCVKRYVDEADGIQLLAKDYLTIQKPHQQ